MWEMHMLWANSLSLSWGKYWPWRYRRIFSVILTILKTWRIEPRLSYTIVKEAALARIRNRQELRSSGNILLNTFKIAMEFHLIIIISSSRTAPRMELKCARYFIILLYYNVFQNYEFIERIFLNNRV